MYEPNFMAVQPIVFTAKLKCQPAGGAAGGKVRRTLTKLQH